MHGISTDTVIQTTWRVPFTVNGCQTFRIAFESTQLTWVSFIIDGRTGTLFQFEGFAPVNQIPNWYSDTPFTRWSITADSNHSVLLDGATIIQQKWISMEPSIQTFLDTFSPQTICALWLGKFGYTIQRSE